MFDLKLLEMGYTSVLKWVCDQGPSLERSNRFHWTIVGEWTCKFSYTLGAPLADICSGTYRLCEMVKRTRKRCKMGQHTHFSLSVRPPFMQ
jgi:hypothetical protein